MFSRPGIFAGTDVAPLSNPGLAEALLPDKTVNVMPNDIKRRYVTDDYDDDLADDTCTFVHELAFVLITITTLVHHGIILCSYKLLDPFLLFSLIHVSSRLTACILIMIAPGSDIKMVGRVFTIVGKSILMYVSAS